MKILVACEKSQRVCLAFREKGHESYSCDIDNCTGGHPEWHLKRDVQVILGYGWDMIIAFPPCTYLTCSAEWAYKDGTYHQETKPGTLTGAIRREAREKAKEFALAIWQSDCGKVAIENPVGKLSGAIHVKPQIIQPYQFGEDASKKTCLWLRGLPRLVGTNRVVGRFVEYPKESGKMVERWENQTDSGQNKLSPSATRAELRGITYRGVAEAMANCWG